MELNAERLEGRVWAMTYPFFLWIFSLFFTSVLFSAFVVRPSLPCSFRSRPVLGCVPPVCVCVCVCGHHAYIGDNIPLPCILPQQKEKNSPKIEKANVFRHPEKCDCRVLSKRKEGASLERDLSND